MGEFNLGSGERPNPHCGKKHSLRLRLSRILTNGRGKNFKLYKVQGLCLVKMRNITGTIKGFTACAYHTDILVGERVKKVTAHPLFSARMSHGLGDSLHDYRYWVTEDPTFTSLQRVK